MGSQTLRASIKAVLDYLGVGEEDKLRIDLKQAPDEALPKMFYEMSSAMAELMGDKAILNTLKIKLPDGKVVPYEEAEKYARSQQIEKPIQQPEKPTKFENKPPEEKKYVSADAPFSYRPSKRARSNRPR